MKKLKKVLGFVLGMALFGAAPLFPQNLADLQKAAGDFSKTLSQSLPFNASLGLNWSDAYIGKLFPGLPPHFGVGAALGYTTMDFEAFEELLKQFSLSVPGGFDLGQMALPAYVLEARIGGFFLPFDVGLKFGAFENLGNSSAAMDCLLAGGEVRYAIVDGKKSLLLPNVSLGLGLNYLSGSFTGSLSSLRFSLPGIAGGYLSLPSPEVGLEWETLALDFKAQISKSFLIITPYLGLGASHAWSKTGYRVDTALDATKITQINTANTDLKNAGLDGIDVNAQGFSTILEETGWSFRAFGGLSVNLTLFRLDLTGLYNFFDGNYGVSLGGRIQI